MRWVGGGWAKVSGTITSLDSNLFVNVNTAIAGRQHSSHVEMSFVYCDTLLLTCIDLNFLSGKFICRVYRSEFSER